jgi:hypothetical protein
MVKNLSEVPMYPDVVVQGIWFALATRFGSFCSAHIDRNAGIVVQEAHRPPLKIHDAGFENEIPNRLLKVSLPDESNYGFLQVYRYDDLYPIYFSQMLISFKIKGFPYQAFIYTHAEGNDFRDVLSQNSETSRIFAQALGDTPANSGALN